jgi:hypothetical protein
VRRFQIHCVSSSSSSDLWYKYSSKSSINKILSEQSIADGEPNKLYKIDRFPPTNSPKLFLFYFSQKEEQCRKFFSNNAIRSVSMACVVALGAVIGIIP